MEKYDNRPVRVGMISTGDEVMQGSIVDTNAAWLANLLNEQGVDMVWRASVGDQLAQLVQVFTDATHWCDVVIVNGGLGPTTDDLSAEAAAEFLGEPLELFDAWKQVLETRYAKRFKGLSASNLKQAMLPQSATIIDNPKGSACGFEIIKNKTRFWFTPGVPSEFKAMVKQELLPRLSLLSSGQCAQRVMRWHTFGLREAQLNERLSEIVLPEGIRFGYRAVMPDLEVKLFYPEGHPALAQLVALVEQELGEFIFATNGTSLAEQVQSLMVTNRETLATAESCTGGMIASALVDVAGSSAYFDRGFVTYTNLAKQEAVAVSPDTLAEHGAVSVEVAAQMAQGARQAAKSTVGLATSGIAGPDGGSEEKPVGTVAVALATEQGCYTQLFHLPSRGRTFIREMTATIALDMLRRYLQQQPVFGDYAFERVTSVVIPPC